MLKTKLIKISFYLLTIFVLHLFVYDSFSNVSKAPNITGSVNQALSDKNAIIYFGDSSVDSGSPKDEALDKRLGELVPEFRVYPAYHPAYHLGVYSAYVHYIARNESKQPLLIIPINLRSFSFAWSDAKNWQFNKLIVFLQYQNTAMHVFHNFFQAIGALDLVYGFYDSVLEDTNDMRIYEGKYHNYTKYQYLYELEEDHKRLRNLESLLKRAKESNLRIFFYFTPLIYKDIVNSEVKNAQQILESNKAIVKNLINSYGYDIHNFTYLLPSYRMISYEHMTSKGKNELANAIAAELKTSYLLP